MAAGISRCGSTVTTSAVLAAYRPIVALLAGNSGAQGIAVIIRSLAVGDRPLGRAGRAIRREVAIGLIDGTVVALVAAFIGAVTIRFFQAGSTVIEPFEIAMIIFVSVWVAFVVAGAVGSGIPIVLKKLGQDPALASNIFLTMTTDIVGFTGFLLTATILLA